MQRWFRLWAPVAGALLVAAATLGWGAWQRSQAPLERTGQLLDTYVRVVAVDGEREAAADAALASLRRTEAALNRYDPASTVARINQAAGGWAPLDPLTLKALRLVRETEPATGGSFDVALGQVLDLYDFGGGGRVPAEAKLATALALAGPRAWELDAAGQRARLFQPGTTLDLGGMHKGLAVDEALAQLTAHGVTRGLVDAGGNMRAVGTRPDGKDWRIGIQHPRQPDKVLAAVPLRNRAVATSGDYQQYFERNGQRYHHLLDPRTGKPANRALSVTVLAPTAVEADLLSTTLFILGPEEGLAVAARWPGVDALWVTNQLELVMTPGMQRIVEVQP